MDFPIDQLRDTFRAVARQPGACILLSAPTGSGKSTRVPSMMLEAGWGERGVILVVQPRRLAARLLAGFVARQFPCPLGREVGYAVRFESRYGPRTKILFVTDGILERRLTEDPTLRGVSAIVFDEVHERRLSGDLCLARAMELRNGERPDLGIVAMSATLEIDALRRYLGRQCALLEAQGRMYPVAVAYRPPKPARNARGAVAPPPVWEQCAAAVKELVQSPDAGDVLVFLPGAYEINKTAALLEHAGWLKGRDVFPLHGALSPEAQNRAVEPGERPRVILATNIAETSLTIQGVRSVVDAGTAREARWDPRRGISTLHVVPVSQAQAEQRRGRAGRLGPGRCIRLWSEAEQGRRPAFPVPEIRRADLSAAFLNILAWGARGLAGIENFRWLDAPSPEESERAWNLLDDLGAIAPGGGISPLGRRLLRYPLPPVLARLILAGEEERCLPEMAAVAALLQGENVAMASGLAADLREEDDFSDFQTEWRAVERASALRFAPVACAPLGIMARAAREVVQIYGQLLRGHGFTNLPEPDFHPARRRMTKALLDCFPDRLGARNGASNTARLTRGRGGKINAGSVALHSELFIAADVAEIGGRNVETRLGRCTRLTLEELEEHPELRHEDRAIYDRQRRRVLLRHLVLYRDLAIRDREKGDAPPELAAPLLAEQVVKGELTLARWDGQVEQWLRRLNGLRRWMPELELPPFDKEDRLVAVAMVCEGAVGYKDIKDRPVLPVLEEWLSPRQRAALDRYAPTSVALANGRIVKLRYREDSQPVFGLKVQQLFGVRETPRIAEGKIGVLVEILAPNLRPWQTTGNLASFWETGYAQMKKDLAGRYPRHAWPDAP